MGSVVKKAMKKIVGVEKIFGTDKLTGGIYDKYLGTDILGKKEAQEKEAAAERARNQAALNSQNNANILSVNGTENVVQTDTGGTAAAVASGEDNDLKKRRTGGISSVLGI